MQIYFARGRGRCSEFSVNRGSEPAHITSSVGEGGGNKKPDVTRVQSLLNGVDVEDGGSNVPLAVDGICGPKTKAAILHFQRHHPGLIADSRIDPNKNTWKKLVEVSSGNDEPILPKRVSSTPQPAAKVDDATQKLFVTYLWYTRHRIFETIKAIDTSMEELEVCRAYADLYRGKSLHDGYVHYEIRLQELPTFHRCFKIVDPKMTIENTRARLKRVRLVYTHMVDVIVANTFTTPTAEKNHSREFLRVVDQKYLDWAHGRNQAMADAPLGGWWHKDARRAQIRYGSDYIQAHDAFTTLIHELAHFVSHSTTYRIDHEGGSYNQAFKATSQQCVRNAYCYEWYAMLACFKSLRRQSDSELNLS
jgi:peptidoglycan hydrolase-like protein with peptidoglycan-binding domain